MQLNTVVIKNESDFWEYYPEIIEHKLVSIDTETTGLDTIKDRPVLFQIGTEEKQYIIHWYNVNILPLKNFLESQEIIKVFHNHKFDYKFIKYHAGITIDSNIYDTFLAELVLLGGRAKVDYTTGASLKDQAKKYLGVELDKTIRIEFAKWVPGVEITEQQIEYSAGDIVIPLKLRKIQTELLKKENMEKVARLEFSVSSAIGDIELNGMYIDQKMWLALAQKVLVLKETGKKKLDHHFVTKLQTNLFGAPNINYDSPEQLKEALTKIGIDVPDTNSETLKEYYEHEVIRDIEEYRKWSKSESTYGKNFLKNINPKTNRLHPDFWPMVSTGRLSCREPNLQNIKAPKTKDDLNFRDPFTAQYPAKEILTADYSGCELRVLAELSQDPVLVESFQEELVTNSEADPHSKVSSMLFNQEVSKTVNPHLRKRGKNLNFGLIYGMGARKLGRDLQIPKTEAADLISLYFKTFPKIHDYLRKSAYQAIHGGYSVTLSGRKRYYDIPKLPDFIERHGIQKGKQKYDRLIGHLENCGKNTPIQGTNGDIIKLALIYIRKDIIENKRSAKLINTVHDEIVLEGTNLEEYKPTIIKLMCDAEAYFLKTIPPRVDAIVDKSWSK